MPFDVRTRRATAGDRTGDIIELTDGSVSAEIWPQWGFNCLRWRVRQGDLLYTAPDWEQNPVPTRSGHPVLFPFPGRFRDGTFSFAGRAFHLPLNDSTRKNAIHGFTPRNRWRTVRTAADHRSATATGEFELQADLPESAPLWPANFKLALTYELRANCLRVEAAVFNLGPGPMPFGLGYHGYFRLPGVSHPDIGRYVLQASIGTEWESENNLPTGKRLPIAAQLDFRRTRPIGALELDHAFTIASPAVAGSDLFEAAVLSHPDAPGRLLVLVDASFRELILFTPPHRQAIAIEPYTCTADAANLASRGIDSGWRTLPEGENWRSVVEYRWEPEPDTR